MNLHKQKDKNEEEKKIMDKEKCKDRIKKLQKKVDKIKKWMEENGDRVGANGKIRKSNITDNESAKMPSSHGVIQGYNGIAVVDDKNQVIVEAQAHGEGQEQKIFKDVLEGTEKRLEEIGKGKESLKETKIITDSGFHTKENVNIAEQKGLDAYMPDKGFRKRDPRFTTAARHNNPVDRKKTSRKNKWYKAEDFTYDDDKKTLVCPAGKPLYIRNRNDVYKGRKAIAYMAHVPDCRICSLRKSCIRKQRTLARQVRILYDYEGAENKVLKKMKEKIDNVVGRHIYSMRMKIVEPIFGNIRNNIGLLKFSLRGSKKVGIQWKLFAIIHNIGKIARYGYGFT